MRRRFPAVFIRVLQLNTAVAVDTCHKPFSARETALVCPAYAGLFDGAHDTMLRNASKFILETYYGAPCARS